jgi:hypothetical protein
MHTISAPHSCVLAVHQTERSGVQARLSELQAGVANAHATLAAYRDQDPETLQAMRKFIVIAFLHVVCNSMLSGQGKPAAPLLVQSLLCNCSASHKLGD